MSASARRLVVVGAGISGLTAAYVARRDAPHVDVTVVEAGTRAGGKIATDTLAGRPLDLAADAFLARVPEALALCHELGLADQLVTPATRRAYLYTRGALRPFPERLSLGVPTDLDALAASGVVSTNAVARAARDLDTPEPPPDGDESVGALVRRRVGDEVYETLVAPLLSGVYAGDADRLSVAVAAPQFAAALREHGSLIAGLRAQLDAAARNDTPVFYGLRDGTAGLTDALAARIEALGGRLLTGRHVTALTRRDHSSDVLLDDGTTHRADALVLATPDFVTASLLRDAAPTVAGALADVPYASVVLVGIAVAAAQLREPLDGTGFLVPEHEGLLLSACSWASSKWAHLDGDPVLLRASAGRITDERPQTLDDDALVELVWRDLQRTMGVRGSPAAARVARWPRALPQFAPGHLDRLRSWELTLAERWPTLALAGAGIAGLGLPACIRRATVAIGQLQARDAL
jgi:oxygen-dependent protoporphyrinogen oxidase